MNNNICSVKKRLYLNYEIAYSIFNFCDNLFCVNGFSACSGSVARFGCSRDKKEQRIEHEASAFHNPDINEKMWMAEKGKELVGTAWNIKYGESGFSSKRSGLPSYIPSIEGVFNKRNGSNAGASYNYGNNHISHLAFDILPWLIMD